MNAAALLHACAARRLLTLDQHRKQPQQFVIEPYVRATTDQDCPAGDWKARPTMSAPRRTAAILSPTTPKRQFIKA